jgi:urea transport system ATP-binding protein
MRKPREGNTTMLQIDNLHVQYGESSVLRDVTLAVPPGKVVCLLGRNGVGKTTLIKSVMGLLRPRTGRVLLDGAEVTHWSPSRRARAGVGYVPQGRGIFPHLTVYENLLIGFEAAPNRRHDAGALEEVYTLFPVLKQMRARLAGTLSGGQQQQLAFGRVLLRRPQLLLLDEPTEGIQPSIMAQIEDLIRSLREGGRTSILLVEQYLDFALNVGNYFYVMETGTIVMHGAATEFNSTVAREYLAV